MFHRSLNVLVMANACFFASCTNTQPVAPAQTTGGMQNHDAQVSGGSTTTGGNIGHDDAAISGGVVTSGGLSDAGDASQVDDSICDGSDEIRLGVTSGGGFVESTYDFTNPYGDAFLFVDGHCHYWASTAYMEGIFEGVLDSSAEKDLAQRVAWADLLAWSSFMDLGCPDAGVTVVRGRGTSFYCSCGCDQGAPAGMEDVILGATPLMKELVSSGTALTGTVSLIALDLGADATGTALSWPLSWDVADIAITQDQLIGNTGGLGTVINDAGDAMALRELRATSLATAIDKRQVQVDTTSSGHYTLFIRDELPQKVAAAIDAFLQ